MTENQAAQAGPTWRVYTRQWCIVFVSELPGEEGKKAAEIRFSAKYEGKIEPGDSMITPVAELEPDRFPYQLELRLWVMQLAATTRDHAEAVLKSLTNLVPVSEPVMVQEGSSEERELVTYGQRKLSGGS